MLSFAEAKIAALMLLSKTMKEQNNKDVTGKQLWTPSNQLVVDYGERRNNEEEECQMRKV